MKAIIVAAGRGSRMGELTANKPKCFQEFAGRRLIDWQLDSLSQAGIDEITVATGYQAKLIENLGLETRYNKNWNETNMVASLMCARDVLMSGSDILVAYADIIYESRLIEALCANSDDIATIIDLGWESLWRVRFEDPLSDAESLVFDEDFQIVEIGQKATSVSAIQGQYIGLTKFSARGATCLVDLYDTADTEACWLGGKQRENAYLTDILTGLIGSGQTVRAVTTQSGWLEFDSATDLERYQGLTTAGHLHRYWSGGAGVASW